MTRPVVVLQGYFDPLSEIVVEFPNFWGDVFQIGVSRYERLDYAVHNAANVTHAILGVCHVKRCLGIRRKVLKRIFKSYIGVSNFQRKLYKIRDVLIG